MAGTPTPTASGGRVPTPSTPSMTCRSPSFPTPRGGASAPNSTPSPTSRWTPRPSLTRSRTARSMRRDRARLALPRCSPISAPWPMPRSVAVTDSPSCASRSTAPVRAYPTERCARPSASAWMPQRCVTSSFRASTGRRRPQAPSSSRHGGTATKTTCRPT